MLPSYPNINTEFSRYLLVLRLKKLLPKGKPREVEEALNILERLLLAYSEDLKDGDSDIIMDHRKLESNYPAVLLMNQEFKKKGFDFDSVVLLQEISNWLNRKEDEICPQPFLTDNVLSLPGYFSHPFPKHRLPSILSSIKSSDEDKIIILTTIFLRYECILQRGQHWTNAMEMYCSLVDDYGFDVEGFASPFNSQIIQLDKGLNFCSLFPDTDSVVGSLGSFFNYPSFVGRSVAVCPPYTEQILDDILQVILRDCERAVREKKQVRFFLGIPSWDDTALIKTLDTYEHTVFKIGKMDIYFTDNRSDSIILNSFGNYYYMVSVNYPPDVNYDKIHLAFDNMNKIGNMFKLLSNNLSSLIDKDINVVTKFLPDNWIANKFIAEKLIFSRKISGNLFSPFNKFPDYIRSHILADILFESYRTNRKITDLISKDFNIFAKKYTIIPLS